eukprot:GEMP01023597.1.p1 GENE.GEMP01023597.1~~GEMP01023597.1.p1  ORF type:complete len:371 (+),score=87.37 GEMP01023597.1:906-2018(+)
MIQQQSWPEYDEEWFETNENEWGTSVQCLACGKYADEFHIRSPAHLSRVKAWKDSQKKKIQPMEEWLMHVFWTADGKMEHEMGLKCLLCDRFCQDLASHGTNVDKASREHKKRLENYSYYVEDVRQTRETLIRNDKTGLMKEVCERQKARLQGPPRTKSSQRRRGSHNSNHVVNQTIEDCDVAGHRSPKTRKSTMVNGSREAHADASVFHGPAMSQRLARQKPTHSPPPVPVQTPEHLPEREDAANNSDDCDAINSDIGNLLPRQRVASHACLPPGFRPPPGLEAMLEEQEPAEKDNREDSVIATPTVGNAQNKRVFVVVKNYDGIERIDEGCIEGGYLALIVDMEPRCTDTSRTVVGTMGGLPWNAWKK